MLEAEEREQYIQGARLRCCEGSKYRVRRAAPAVKELGTTFVYRDPTPSKLVTDSKLRPAQVRNYVLCFHSQTEPWFCFLLLLVDFRIRVIVGFVILGN